MYQAFKEIIGAGILLGLMALVGIGWCFIAGGAIGVIRNEWNRLPVGTRSVLFGAHCFFLHPWFVAAGWWKLYGFPFDPRLWFAFFLHDLGYWGLPNMDGPEGELHPEFGALIMHRLFDWQSNEVTWMHFCLFHSRYYSKAYHAQPSRLCFADKLAFALTPRWLYLPMTTLTGEIDEYLKNAQKAESAHWKPTGYDKKLWHKQLCEYMTKWVDEHLDGAQDTWTSANRHARSESGVWQ